MMSVTMMKKGVLSVLGAAFVMWMSGCSMGADEGAVVSEPVAEPKMREETRETGSREPEAVKTENPEPGLRYTYSSTIVNLEEYGDNVIARDIAGRGERVYALLEVRKWGAEPEDSTQKQEYTSCYQVFSCMADGSGKTISGEIFPSENGGYVNDFYLSDDGCVAALYYSDTDDSVSLLFWDVFQDIHWEKEILAGGYLFFQEDGFVLLARKGEGREAHFYDAGGNLTGTMEMEGEGFSNFRDCYYTQDNRFLVIASDIEGRVYAECYDPEDGQLQKQMLPEIFQRYQVFQGTTADFLLCDSAGVYQLDLDRNVLTEMLCYVDADLDVGWVQMVQQIDETRFAGVFVDSSGAIKLGLFSRTETSEELQKQVVVLGLMYELEPGLRRQLISFNQKNSRYRITIKRYVTYDDESDAIARLNTDILSGNMPDILLVDQKMPIQSYAAKGLLADVGKLLDEDEELDRGQFMENVLDAFRINGTLYHVIPAFCVDTLVAKQSKAGDRKGWNQEEFSEVLEGLPEGMEMLSETSRYDYLEDYMRVCGREYVDIDQRKCNFQSESFVAALEFARTLPEYAAKMADVGGDIIFDSRYLEDRALLHPVTIRYIPNLAPQIYGCMGEDISYVGYPAQDRNGSCIRVYGMSFVLSEGSRLDGAWEFVRYFLTEHFQKIRLAEINGGGLPVRQDVFDEKAQWAVRQEGHCYINNDYIPVPPMTQEQVDRAVDLIKGLHNVAFEDEVVMGILHEEAESFFQGQKTAEEVAGLIQNRVQLYLGEGR